MYICDKHMDIYFKFIETLIPQSGTNRIPSKRICFPGNWKKTAYFY